MKLKLSVLNWQKLARWVFWSLLPMFDKETCFVKVLKM